MKAEDTVVSTTQILVEPSGVVDIKNQLRTQAEISFKAGIMELVKWGNEDCNHTPVSYYSVPRHHCYLCWRAKLKELGVRSPG